MARNNLPRLNKYGEEVVPGLEEVRRNSLRHTATNRESTDAIDRMLEKIYLQVLHRGRYVEISLKFSVKDGIIMLDTLTHGSLEQWREHP